MKHNYDEPTMQAAIDAACKATASSSHRPSFALLRLEKSDINDDWTKEQHSRLHLAEKLLELLPESSPPVVDGKTPGQVNHDAVANGDYDTYKKWSELSERGKRDVERGASAVLAAFGNKPAEIPWTEWHGGGCPLKDEQVEEWGCELRDGRKHTNVGVNSAYWRWQHLSRHDDIIAYRVTKWREGFGPVDWKSRAEKAEAELANWKEAAQVAKWQRDLIIDESTDKTGRILELEKLSTLRPISEAGDVPAGCVRVYWNAEDGAGVRLSKDTHFADIRLPAEPTPEVIHDGGEVFEVADPYAELKAAHAKGKGIEQSGHGSGDWFECGPVIAWSRPVECYRIKPAPETFEANGKTWTRHTPGDPMPCDGERYVFVLFQNGEGLTVNQPAEDWKWGKYGPYDTIIGWRYADEPTKIDNKNISDETIMPSWTPSVGDVVTLSSGGPKMTVVNNDDTKVTCLWFNSSLERTFGNFLTATIIPA